MEEEDRRVVFKVVRVPPVCMVSKGKSVCLGKGWGGRGLVSLSIWGAGAVHMN